MEDMLLIVFLFARSISLWFVSMQNTVKDFQVPHT